MAARKCPKCHADMPADLLEGFCPRCVLKSGTAEDDDSDACGPTAAPSDAPGTPQGAGATSAGPDGDSCLTGSGALVSEQPGDRIGRYKLLEQIGEGGCGVVFMAEQAEPIRRKVALKVIKLGMDTKSVIARFEAERQALALMDHPNIAKVFDAGATDAGRPYFVMELVRGVRITDYCDQHNLPIRARLDLFTQVCHAMQHAHQKGIIHRDIKPSNILVTLHDGVPVPKVIDFGIAKATSDQRLTDKTLFTAFEQFMGTPAYMSPEQAGMSGLDIDTRSDIYALGVLLYELLTGKTPFDSRRLVHAGLDEIRRIIREEEPPRPSTRLSTLAVGDLTTIAKQHQSEPAKLTSLIRGDLDWIVMKCLEKDRVRRYETANGLAADVQRHLSNEPVIARPPSASYQVGKFVRKHRAAVTVIAGFLLLLTIATTISVGLAIWANRERTDAIKARKEAQRKAADEASANALAQAHQKRAEETLAQIQMQRAEEFFSRDQAADGMAHLAALIRQNPGNRVAAERLLSALAHRPWWRPRPVVIEGAADRVSFSPDGLWLVTTHSYDKEARLWDTRTGKPLAQPLRHARAVRSAMFSPTGDRVLTAAEDGARLWETRTGQPLTGVMQHDGHVDSAEFSPDGTRLVTVSHKISPMAGRSYNAVQGVARLWNAQTGVMEREVYRCEGRGFMFCAAFSPNGRWILTTSQDNKVRFWETESGKLISSVTLDGSNWGADGRPQFHLYASFSPDGQRLVTSTDSKTRVWDILSGRPLTEELSSRHFSQPHPFSPDGQRLVTTAWDKQARLWDAITGQPIGQPLEHANDMSCAFFSPEGQRVVTASRDRTARVWSAKTGQPLTEPLRHDVEVVFAAFSPDGGRVATISADKKARVWDARTALVAPDMALRRGAIRTVEWSPDGRHLVTGSQNGVAGIWDASTGRPLCAPLPHESYVGCVAFSPDGARFLTASGSGSSEDVENIRFWDAQTGRPSPGSIRAKGTVTSASFSPDGRRIVATVIGDSARVWDAQTGRELAELKDPSETRFGDRSEKLAAFSPDGTQVLTCYGYSSGRVWDATTGKPSTPPMKHKGWVNSAVFSPDGRQVLTASQDGTALIWDARTGSPVIQPIRHESQIVSASFSHDGRHVATASEDKTARVWEARTSQPLSPSLRHQGAVSSAAFGPDGLRLVTASIDGSLRVWDVQTGLPLSEPLRHAGSMYRASFSPDGSRLLVVSTGDVLVWNLFMRGTNETALLTALAEVVGGKRLTGAQAIEDLSFDERQSVGMALQSKLAAERTGAVPAVGHWFLAGESPLTISPGSAVRLEDYARGLIADGSTNELMDAFLRLPTNAVLSARLALFLSELDPLKELWAQGDARFLAGWAQRFAQLEPATAGFLGRALVNLGRAEESLAPLSRAIAAEDAQGARKEALAPLLLARARTLQTLNRNADASADWRRAKAIPLREPNASSTLIDLTPHFNASLDEDWQQAADRGMNLASLEKGVQKVAGKEFDIRGIIQLAGTSDRWMRPGYPTNVNGIRVMQKCHALHFLEGASYYLRGGTVVARYVVHFRDGQSEDVPVISGRDVENWSPPAGLIPRTTDPQPAWSSKRSNRTGTKTTSDFRLYVQSWQNPRPDVEVTSVDFVSSVTESGPFLIALTVEL